MALPKRKTSKANKRMRRSHLAMDPPVLVNCPQCGNPRKPHHVCPTCGTYKGKDAIAVKAPKAKSN
jgi:large subunit ribosomal protein L32